MLDSSGGPLGGPAFKGGSRVRPTSYLSRGGCGGRGVVHPDGRERFKVQLHGIRLTPFHGPLDPERGSLIKHRLIQIRSND